jgi:hypothetical protein
MSRVLKHPKEGAEEKGASIKKCYGEDVAERAASPAQRTNRTVRLKEGKISSKVITEGRDSAEKKTR